MPRSSPSTRPRTAPYAPSVVAHRKPKRKPDAKRPVLIRDLSSAEVDAVDALVDARNAALSADGERTARSPMLARWIRERLAAEAKGGAS